MRHFTNIYLILLIQRILYTLNTKAALLKMNSPLRNCLAGNSPPLQVVAYQQTFSYEKPFWMTTAYWKDVKIALFFFSLFNASLVQRKRIGGSNVDLRLINENNTVWIFSIRLVTWNSTFDLGLTCSGFTTFQLFSLLTQDNRYWIIHSLLVL